MSGQPDFTLGIEEEYLIVGRQSRDLTDVPAEMMEACAAAFPGRVSPEFLRCQIEVGTGVCGDIAAARAELRELRGGIAREAARFALAPIAVSCHPFADWHVQQHTPKERYEHLSQDLAGVAARMLICGMHVHVGIPDPDARIDLMAQLAYFLPHLLALSASSPFWQGEDTGLASYRLTVFDNLPRTGLPPPLANWAEFERVVRVLTDLGLIEDGTKIWWDIRPSSRFPTLETRICDLSPRLERTLTLAALIQSLARYLWRLRRSNRRWRDYDRFLLAENRWRAQRYGSAEGLIDFGRREIVPYAELVDELIALVAEDADALGCRAEVEAARGFAAEGSSADQQRRLLAEALAGGADRASALRAVVDWLVEEYGRDLA